VQQLIIFLIEINFFDYVEEIHKVEEVLNFKPATALVQEKLIEWWKSAILLLPNFVIALILIVIAFLIGIYVRKVVRSILSRILKNVSLINFLSVLAHVGVLLVGIFISLNILHLDKAIISLLTGVGIIGIGLGFALQDTAANFFSGIALVSQTDRPFKVGDIIETNELIGTVKEINLRDTVIQTFQGQAVFVPNKQIFENPLVNYTLFQNRRIDLSIGISYGENLEHVEKVTLESVKDMVGPYGEKPKLYFTEFGDSSINFFLHVWIIYSSNIHYLETVSKIIKDVKSAYNQNNITIPFPIRTLDFGIKGGKTLAEVMDTGNAPTSIPH